MLLRRTNGGSVAQRYHSFTERLRTQLCQTCSQSQRILILTDRSGLLQNDIAGIQFLRHIHNGDTGLFQSIQDSPVDGSCTTIGRQQRGMDIDGAILGIVQQFFRQDLAVGCHDNQLRIQGLHDSHRFTVTGFHRLVNLQILGQRIFLHGSGLHFVSTVLGLVRLGDHTANFMAVFHQALQGRHSKIRRSHKQDPHSYTSSSASRYSRSSFSVRK